MRPDVAACAAIVRRVAALCSRVGMVDSDGIKNAAGLVFLRLRRYSGIVLYIIYYILFFLVVVPKKNGVPFGAPSFLIPFPVLPIGQRFFNKFPRLP